MCSSLVTSKSSNPMGSHSDSACGTPNVNLSTEEAVMEQVGWFLCQQEPRDLYTQAQKGLDMADVVFV